MKDRIAEAHAVALDPGALAEVASIADRALSQSDPARWREALMVVVARLRPDPSTEADDSLARVGAESAAARVPGPEAPGSALVDFDVARLVESMAESSSYRVGPGPVELICLVDAAVPRRVTGRPDAVRRVLSELLDNALRFTETGAVCVECGWSDGLRLTVSDTGPGMPPPLRARYFGGGARPGGRQGWRPGDGGVTGLALCSMLVADLGGSMTCTARSGSGTLIDVRLPSRAADATERPLPDRIEGRVLLIEDEPRLRSGLARVLEDLGFLVDEAGDGRSAVRAVRRATTAYDLAIVDAELPDAPGQALLDLIGDRPALQAVPRVAMTRDDAARGPRVRKPVTRWRLERAVERALGRRLSRGEASAAAPVDERCVLVVDDNADSRALAARTLGASGYAVDVAVDGIEAVRMASERLYDLILMDIEMPRMGGLEAARSIRDDELPAHRVPIVAVTAHDDEAFRKRCLDAGMDDHVPRPVRRGRLLRAVERALGVLADAAAGTEPPAPVSDDPLGGELAAVVLGEDVLDLLPDFVANRRADVSTLWRWLEGSVDDAEARRVAHGLKGVGGAFGFPAISALGARVGQAARDGARDQARACVERLDRHVEQIASALAGARA